MHDTPGGFIGLINLSIITVSDTALVSGILFKKKNTSPASDPKIIIAAGIYQVHHI